MILPKGGDERGHFGGPLDVLLIQHDLTTGRYHPAAYEEKPMPGPIRQVSEMTTVRLKSKMHHTQGFGTLEEARQYLLDDLATKIEVPEGNVWPDEERLRPVEAAGPDVLILPNWTLEGAAT